MCCFQSRVNSPAPFSEVRGNCRYPYSSQNLNNTRRWLLLYSPLRIQIFESWIVRALLWRQQVEGSRACSGEYRSAGRLVCVQFLAQTRRFSTKSGVLGSSNPTADPRETAHTSTSDISWGNYTQERDTQRMSSFA